MLLKKSSDFGRSRGRCLDFLLLIGAFVATATAVGVIVEAARVLPVYLAT
jgi:hypothetical protein